MKNIENLRQATDMALSGLNADDSLKFRILREAAQPSGSRHRSFSRAVPVLCSLIALLLVSVIALNSLKPVDPSGPAEMNVFAAGSQDTDGSSDSSSGSFLTLSDFSILSGSTVQSFEITGLGKISDPDACASLVRVLAHESKAADTETPPASEELLITVDGGGVYRLLTADPYLAGETVWSCDSFFTLFRQYTAE